jgi:hypothetical protein
LLNCAAFYVNYIILTCCACSDFDEQTADDWDVDMAVYYDPEAGDKDARDFIDKRLTDRRRQGRDDADKLLPDKLGPIGSFEKHTKVHKAKSVHHQSSSLFH